MHIDKGVLDEDEFLKAENYDKMIPWESRLAREIPLIVKKLHPGTILDMACSSGRHTFALEKHGFKSLGVDYSKEMIYIAQNLKEEYSSPSNFLAWDGADIGLCNKIKEEGLKTYYDNALLLGNAIANLGSFDAGKRLLANIFMLLRPGGLLFSQTVFRPSKPHYMPIRTLDEDTFVQRIMIPDEGEDHNMVLHVNQINRHTGEYITKKDTNYFFMYTLQEYQELLESLGFRILETFGGYKEETVKEENGSTVIWIIEKPEIKLFPEGLDLFEKYAKIDENTVKERVLLIWQDLMLLNNYHCIRGYRFLFPRITSHPQYSVISEDFADKNILDIGCNLGTDIRKMIVDGANPENIVGLDITNDYFDLGYQLFGDREELKVKFIADDVTNPQKDDLLTITNDRNRQFGVIHSGSVLHLLSEENIGRLMTNIVQLLAPGGIFFGRTVGNDVPISMGNEGGLQYLHSRSSLEELFQQYGLEDIEITEMGENTPVGERSQSKYLSFMFYARTEL